MGRLVLVVKHLGELLVFDILLDVVESSQRPFLARGLFVFPALSLLVLRSVSDDTYRVTTASENWSVDCREAVRMEREGRKDPAKARVE